MEADPLAYPIAKLFRARVEFRHFVEQTTRQGVKTLAHDDDRLQIALGLEGPILLYGLGPAGEVMTLIHGLAAEAIVLRAGNYSSYQLRTRLQRDLRDLAAYVRVTGGNARPTLGERLRVGWLRWTRGIGMAKADETSILGPELESLALRTTAKAVAIELALRLLAIVLLAGLVWLAFPETVLKVAHWFADKGR